MDTQKYPWSVEFGCSLVGFFALNADEQRALVPSKSEPVYAAFNAGDGLYTRPLQILLNHLEDAAKCVSNRHAERECSFVPKHSNDTLLETIHAVEKKWCGDDEIFATEMLDVPEWNALRDAARNIWLSLDAQYQRPFGQWRDYLG